VNRNYRRDELAGVYRAARVGLVTPLRDGMNLVAKEYVAAQDPEDPGVLVLSRFAGAARQMTEAVIVNPFSHEEMAEAIKRALTMPKPERIDRWQSLMDGVRRSDVRTWRDAFVYALRATRQATPVSELPTAPRGWRGVQSYDPARPLAHRPQGREQRPSDQRPQDQRPQDQRPLGAPRGPTTDPGA
jgi:trehalose 6-phosphate synthase